LDCVICAPRRRERFVSLIAIISLAGVTLGTFALTVALSVMSGFQEDLRNRLLAFHPADNYRCAPTAACGIPPISPKKSRPIPGVIRVGAIRSPSQVYGGYRAANSGDAGSRLGWNFARRSRA